MEILTFSFGFRGAILAQKLTEDRGGAARPCSLQNPPLILPTDWLNATPVVHARVYSTTGTVT